MEINKKLKSMYFQWADNYDGPPPRSLSGTFEDYLHLERYTFLGDENWLSKVLTECDIETLEIFDEQMVLIKSAYELYTNQQYQKCLRIQSKENNIHFAYCQKNDTLPF
jgi:hypothetical protein